MEYIYSRVSTDQQETQNQLFRLKQLYPNAEVVEETISGYKEKPVLNALLARLTHGDTLVVSALDRLGRHAQKALKLIEDLQRQGIKMVSIREGIDTATSSGKFVATCMFGLAEMERNLISERTKAALAAKKAAGVKLGRPPRLTIAAIGNIRELRQAGNSLRAISEIVGCSAMHVSRVLKRPA